MNRINDLFLRKKQQILSIYFTAGHPEVDSTPAVIDALSKSGVDMIEIGMPFSDPMADGPVIQSSSNVALKNGMSLKLLFQQLKNIRSITNVPLLLMGYLNPVLQYGFEEFCRECADTGIDGVILPDLPPEMMESNLLISGTRSADLFSIFSAYHIQPVFLISPQTADERIRKIDKISNSFIYMVSSSSTTGQKGEFGKEHLAYFSRIQAMNLRNPLMTGFGISNHQSFETVCRYSSGAIIGSAFVKMLSESEDISKDTRSFIQSIRGT